MKRKEQLAYLAGIIDGEGSICLHRDYGSIKRTRRGFAWKPRLIIYNSNEKLFRWLEKNFPKIGNLYWYKRNDVIGRRREGRWTISPKKIQIILPQLLPFLVIKKTLARYLLQSLEILKHRNKYYSIEYDKELERLYLLMKKLNS